MFPVRRTAAEVTVTFWAKLAGGIVGLARLGFAIAFPALQLSRKFYHKRRILGSFSFGYHFPPSRETSLRARRYPDCKAPSM